MPYDIESVIRMLEGHAGVYGDEAAAAGAAKLRGMAARGLDLEDEEAFELSLGLLHAATERAAQ